MKKLLTPLIILFTSLILAPITSFAQSYNDLSVEKRSQEEISAFVNTHPTFNSDIYSEYSQPHSITLPYNMGMLNDEALQDGLNQLNIIRFVGGLNANITLDPQYTAYAQAASLVNQINNTMSHSPTKPEGMSDELYNLGKKGAASSNLGWGYNNASSNILGCLDDSSIGNLSSVGHRRWILNPKMQKTGFGRVNSHSAMYAFDSSNSQANTTAIVAWPAANTPINLVRPTTPFSLSLGDDFSRPKKEQITITLTRERGDKIWVFDKNTSSTPSTDDYFSVSTAGYGQNKCLIWRPNVTNTKDLYKLGDKFTVTIDGLTRNSSSYPIKYEINLFDHNYPNSASYMVEFNSNGSTQGTMDVMHLSYGQSKALPNAAYQLRGYTFAGWSLTPSGEVAYSDGGTVKNLSTQNNGIVTLYAKWAKNSYKIRFIENWGTGTMENLPMEYDTPKNLPDCTLKREGYRFDGWAKTSTGPVVYANKAEVNNLTTYSKHIISLYAKWTPINYTISFNSNGGTGKMADLPMSYLTSNALTSNAFTREGYTFSGWAKSANGKVVYSDKQSVNNLTSADGGSVTLYAVWKPNTYTVKFSPNGGSGTMSNLPMTYDAAKTLAVNKFTRSGYTFGGWAASSSGTVVYSDRQSVNNLSSVNGSTVTLYAVWKTGTYKIRFLPNGGSGTMEELSMVCVTAKALTDNAFTRNGYRFIGWARSASGSVTYKDKQSVKDLTTQNNATVVLYAKWEKLPLYTIKFNANGGKGSMSSISMTYGTSKPLSANKFTRSGYKFVGWAKNSGGSVAYSDNQSVNNLSSINGSSVTLYAVWKVIPDTTYHIRFLSNGGSGTMEDLPMIYGTSKALTYNTFIREGYTFSGWATTSNGAAIYSNGQSVNNLSSVDSSTVTLYAVWKVIPAKTYTIKFNANGGKGSISSMSMTYGSSKSLSANKFTRSGYKFVGWAKNSGGSVAYKDKQSVKNLTTKDKAAVVLYAKWEKLPRYVIKFNANSGKGTMNSISMTYGSSKALTANRFTRSGYAFAGWARTSRGSVVYNDKQSIKNLTSKNGGTVTLYAKWEKLARYTIKFNANGGKGTMSSLSMTYGSSKALSANRFTRAGYKFAGWAKKSNGPVVYKNKQKVKNLTSKNNGKVTLYAKWK